MGIISNGYLETQEIQETLKQGLEFCKIPQKLTIQQAKNEKILFKPDIYYAHPKFNTHHYTHPSVVEAAMHCFDTLSPISQKVMVGQSYPGISTRQTLEYAHGNEGRFEKRGYFELEKIFPKNFSFAPDDEQEQYRYFLSQFPSTSNAFEADALTQASNEVLASKQYQDATWSVYLPKLKFWNGYGFCGAVQLGSRFPGAFGFGPLADHHAVDMLQLSSPIAVIGDGIFVASHGNAFKKKGHELGALVIANHPAAHDWVGAILFNQDPLKIPCLEIASKRGWGPHELDDIEIGGAGLEGLEQLAQKARFWSISRHEPLFSSSELPQVEVLKPQSDPHALSLPVEMMHWLDWMSFFPLVRDKHSLSLKLFLQRKKALKAKSPFHFFPKVSIYLSETTTYPQHLLVWVSGIRAEKTFNQKISSKLFSFKFLGIQFGRAALKNGATVWYWILQSHGIAQRVQDPTYAARFWQWTIVFWMSASFAFLRKFISFFRLERRLFHLDFFQRWQFWLNHNPTPKACFTSEKNHNRWWTLSRLRSITRKGGFSL